MFPKTMSELSINGEWPELDNKEVEELIAQEFWYDGECKDQANVLYIRASGKWFRLYFDYSIIFWRPGDNGFQNEYADRSIYPFINFGKELSVIGSKISSCVGGLIEGGAQVEFIFSNGKSFIV